MPTLNAGLRPEIAARFAVESTGCPALLGPASAAHAKPAHLVFCLVWVCLAGYGRVRVGLGEEEEEPGSQYPNIPNPLRSLAACKAEREC
jgi:hypothetical protein